ncbi:MAG: PHP domain-containing protein [Deltaproteobacteria bacterium]|jgi:predicted metal-dependent phosphoesterase TrpH|nr:PHP domain-containing protein [Deltaproteobacteria bacterium]
MRPYVDLHTHSTASDGSLAPGELVRQAAREKITILALTDHDTTAGLDEAEAEAGQRGIEFVRGCELSSQTPYGHADFIGLWLPRDIPAFEEKLAWMREARARRNAIMLEKLDELGLHLGFDPDAFPNLKSLGRPQIAVQMARRGYVKTPQEAFNRYIGRDRPAYVPKEACSPEEAVQMLHAAGAVTVFAHPMLLQCPPDWREELVKRLIPHGLDALEAYHSEHGNESVRRVLELADRCKLLLSGGSDFHGASKPSIRLGRGKGGFRVPEYVLDGLRSRRFEKQGPSANS